MATMTRRLATVAVAITATVAATVVVAAGPASASPVSAAGRINGSCGPKASAFDTDGSTSHVERDVHVGLGAHVHLSRGDHPTYGLVWWGRITKAPNGSKVWMDWSDDGGNNWHQCGPFRVDGSQGPQDRWTWAVNEVRGRTFRACGSVPGIRSSCTSWL